jgi:hypothetical protein
VPVYSVTQNDDGLWVVSTDGQELLVCARKSDAEKAAEDAAALLDQPRTDRTVTPGRRHQHPKA